MSSNAPATAEVRTFPNAKVQPSTEAPEVPAQPVTPVAPPAAEAPAKKKRSVRSFLLPIIGLALLGAGSWYGYNYWTDGRFMIATDDAYVQADMSFVSPKISGYIDKVLVSENQQVKAGDPLFVIDNGDYKIAVGQAEAQIATLAKTLDRIDAQTKAAQASLSQAQAQKIADQAAADNAARAQDRAAQLLKTHVGTQAQLDDAQTALDQAKAALVGADAQIAAAQANIGVLEAQRAESASTLASLQLTRDKAKRDLSFTVLKAPYDGVVGNRSVEQGDLVSPGQKLAVVVPMDKLYIVGNFKETQLGRMVPGEKVRITVDAIDGQTFEGTVSSLAVEPQQVVLG
ncbi:HlyD family secretion protein [Mesorhizobium sp. M2D.F.Ca.ET.224.01.1.1]|uniref:HlyD family secretion protein n=1 Tax=Mesorhizobium sp. M2D.F.Ca.ET.224.01.1.1 TaxID=2563941 RepID=UPI000FCB764B|nr:HlyD family secretion protein [Mesorhizobium sp. M2D.F.Ca.ET.224.01.1.1]RVD57766.1 HlyD family secretion protein [Mesorhizobium sp. M2D.F.Ca.ET.140.01.1.1]TGP76857.1 HlyD family secretion protein [Mesorhizobium sp. M2D.F.Ca.ET.224.01.1.1]TGP95045.1 HlyD family secretion protein [bacterium M00.F.Ca.ET.222.01.1.1]